MPKSSKTYPHEWVVKASWRSTSIKFRVEAHNEKQALRRAEGAVLRMEGGVYCLGVELIQQVR